MMVWCTKTATLAVGGTFNLLTLSLIPRILLVKF